MDTTQLVRQHAPIEYTPLSRGHIAAVVEFVAGKSKQKAAVTAFTDQLLLILPGASSEHLYGPCRWGAIHGKTFPAVGAECQVGVDETNHPVVLWWEGTYEERIATVKKPLVVTGTELEIEKPEAFKGAEALGFENAWKNFEAGRKAEYRKTPFGTVEVRGAIASGETGKSAFKLPVGYRPKELKNFPATTGNGVAGRVIVLETGFVEIGAPAGSEPKVTTFLDPISFTVE